jgi:hypothetical protein
VATTKKTRSKLATTREQQTDTAMSSDSHRLSVSILHSGKMLIPRPIIPVSEIENKEGLLMPSTKQLPDSVHTVGVKTIPIFCTFVKNSKYQQQ